MSPEQVARITDVKSSFRESQLLYELHEKEPGYSWTAFGSSATNLSLINLYFPILLHPINFIL